MSPSTKKQRYVAMIEELRAFYPEERSEVCKSPLQAENYRAMVEQLDTYADAHPEASAMELRRKSYEIIGNDFIPFIFKNSPFYFEAGINGGWAQKAAIGQWVRRKCDGKLKDLIPEDARTLFNERRKQNYILCCGCFVDEIHHMPPMTAILTKGFCGILQEAELALSRCKTTEQREFILTAIEGLHAIHRIQLKFAEHARQMLKDKTLTCEQHRFMTLIAEHAERSPWQPPETFYEGLNAFWFIREILALVDGLAIFSIGHPDAMLIKLYEQDLAAGRITPDEAYDLICRYLLTADCHYNSFLEVKDHTTFHELEIPVTIGGCDEDGNEVYNDITRMILRAHRELDLVFPKVHCRFSAKSSPEYLQELSRDVIAGRCVHTLFSDDAHIPGLVKMGHSLADARRYVCSGCWSANVDSADDIDDANYCNIARILEATIYPEPEKEQAVGISLERIDDAKTFPEVLDKVIGNIIRFLHDVLENYTQHGKAIAKAAPKPVFSVCLEGCLDTLTDTSAGGSSYKPRYIVPHFLANIVDSLSAINDLCFERKVCTLPELLQAVRNNWKNAETLRQQVLASPHWGDNTQHSNELMRQVINALAVDFSSLRNERGGEYLIAMWGYREFRWWGEVLRALPDGRRDGEYLSQSFNPSHFRNQEEITTVLNALGNAPLELLASANVNLTFDGTHTTTELLEHVFRVFAQKGLFDLQPNCFRREDLLDAQIHPERHANLIVKICGFSARFVALSPGWQQEILTRRAF